MFFGENTLFGGERVKYVRPPREHPLWPHQTEGLSLIGKGIRKGIKRFLVVMPTGTGKMTMANELQIGAFGKDNSSMFVAHMNALIGQCAAGLRKVGVHYEQVTSDYSYSWNELCYLGTIQSITSHIKSKKFGTINPKIIVIDECFPKGTLVDGKPIESLQVGDLVRSYNHEQNTIEYKPVVHVFKKETNNLIKLNFSDTTSIVCTPEHPFAVCLEGNIKYLPAKQMLNQEVLKNDNSVSMFYVWNASDQTYGVSTEGWKTLLFCGMFDSLSLSSSFTNQSQVCFCANEDKESDVQSCYAPKSIGYFEADGSRATPTGREREGFNHTTAKVSDSVGLGDRNNNQNPSSRRGTDGLSLGLQGRYCESGSKNCYRDRWALSRSTFTQGSGLKKDTLFRTIRVDSIEIFQSTGINEHRSMPSGNYVYNIEVEDNNNYFVNDVLVHNCHHINMNKGQYKQLILRFPDAIIIGLTATPFRGDGTGLGNIFEEIIQPISIKKAIEEKYLVPPKYYTPFIPDLIDSGKSRSGSDYTEKELKDWFEKNQVQLVGNIVEHYAKYAIDRQGIVFASSVEHSVALAEAFRNVGIVAEHIDGTLDTDKEKHMIARLASGETQVLVNCAKFFEGLDVPNVSVVVLARITKSLGLFMQMIGRGLRSTKDGLKENCLIFDHGGCCIRFGPVEAYGDWTLEVTEGINSTEKIKIAKEPKILPEIECQSCGYVFPMSKICPECFEEQEFEKRGRMVNSIDGDLVEFTGDLTKQKRVVYTKQEKQFFYSELLWMQGKRSDGWVSNTYRNKFDVWPKGLRRMKKVPSAETMAYVDGLLEKYKQEQREIREFDFKELLIDLGMRNISFVKINEKVVATSAKISEDERLKIERLQRELLSYLEERGNSNGEW